MKRHTTWVGAFALVSICSLTDQARAAGEAGAAPAPAPQAASAQNTTTPEVPAAAPGIFTQTKKGNRLHLTVAGHSFTSRDAIEKYLAYRAATAAAAEHMPWFVVVQSRSKGDTVAAPKKDPEGLRYSFRMAYFQPTWRYKIEANGPWKRWSPFSGTPFSVTDDAAKTISSYEASIDIEPRKGMMEDDNPLAFDAGALSDFLVNQVSPPN